MSTIQGRRTVQNINQLSLKRDVSETISFLNQGTYPIVFLSMHPKINSKDAFYNPRNIKLNKRPTDSIEFEWIEDELAKFSTTVVVAVTDLLTTEITVEDASIFVKRDTILNTKTKEQMYIRDVDYTTNVITVKRQFQEVTAGLTETMDIGEILLNTGPAFEEGSGAGDARSWQKVFKKNYVQWFRTPVEFTTHQQSVPQYGKPADPNYQRMLKGIEHMQNMENRFIFGRKFYDKSPSYLVEEDSNHGVSATGGILEFLDDEDVLNFKPAAALTESLFRGYIRDAFQYTKSRTKILFASGTLLTAINGWYEGSIRYNDALSKININAQEINVADGRIILLRHPLFNSSNIISSASSSYNGNFGLLLEEGYMSYAVRNDTVLEQCLLANNKKVIKEEYLTEAGLEFRLPKLHSTISDFTV